MTDHTLLIVAAVILAFLSEFVIQPIAVKIGWEKEMLSFSRRIVISWPISAFIVWAVLFIAYTQYFHHQP